MKTFLQVSLFTFLIAAFAAGVTQAGNASGGSDSPGTDRTAKAKLLHISATVDGSGRMIFTRDSLQYAHLHWDPPSNVVIDGEDWSDFDTAPPSWKDIAGHVDLSKAWIVERSGRDVIALEHTPDGFDLYLCDSPTGSADYEVTIALPRIP